MPGLLQRLPGKPWCGIAGLRPLADQWLAGQRPPEEFYSCATSHSIGQLHAHETLLLSIANAIQFMHGPGQLAGTGVGVDLRAGH